MNKRRIFAERALYFGLFVLLLVSLGLFFTESWAPAVWEVYNRIYFALLLIYTWFIFILLFIGDTRQKTYHIEPNQYKIAVIIPCYNEEPQLLYRSLMSVIRTRGRKEIHVIDDGSANEQVKQLLRKFATEGKIRVHFFPQNRGKRHALHHAITQMISDVDLVVTIDSDTVLDRSALIRIAAPFNDPKIGATSGDVRLLNEKKNYLTRMVASYYWIGLHIYKKAQSALGMVVCCSGCLSAYRASVLRDVVEDFVNQTFFGEQCTHSEDRHLTNLVLKRGWHVKFIPEAISYTETPSTIRGFLKQQQRWKRGYIRECIYTLTYAWRKRPILFLEVLFWELTIPFFSFGLMIALVVTVFTNPSFFLSTLLPAWLVFMCVRYIHIFLYARKRVPGLIIYMFFYDLFLYWQSIYALFTVRNKGWITR